MIVYGHRGARGEAPENTIAGAKHAAARGVRYLEIDLHLSADNQLVVVHDSTLKRTTGVRGQVSSLSAKELAGLDGRYSGTPWPNKRQTGIPTLSALLKSLPEIQHWQLELKGGSARYNAKLADALVAWLEDHPIAAVVTSGEPTLLTEVRRQRPQQATGFVSTLVDPGMILGACGCEYLVAHWSTLVNPMLIKQWQRMGIHISAWTVNDASVIEQLFQLGIDSVITDYPSMAIPLVAALQR